MIVPIEVNSSDIFSQFDISREQLDKALENIVKSLAVIYMSKLEVEASNELHSTRRRYLQSIRLVDSGKLEATVFLDYSKDPLIAMIEEGSGPFDMKAKLLSSPKAKITAKGKRYISIPFRWSTPSAVGESELFSGKMPLDVYNAVRQKELVVPMSGGGMRTNGLSIGEVPKEFQNTLSRPQLVDSSGSILFNEYKHKSSIYEGISKHVDNSAQSTYFSFRRISENSDAASFIHPGFTARRLMDKAFANMDVPTEFGALMDNEFSKLGF